MQSDVRVRDDFSTFVAETEARLRHVLIATLGYEVGRDAAAQALLYGLENWDRVSGMENPAGYLYRVGQRWGRRQPVSLPIFGDVASTADRWIEPGLAPALEALPTRQRVAVVLRHGLDMSYREIAELTGSNEPAVRKNVERALTALRKVLEV
jgi:RNA polymerase sigma-70 factor (ECF subfamily)